MEYKGQDKKINVVTQYNSNGVLKKVCNSEDGEKRTDLEMIWSLSQQKLLLD